MNDIIVAEKHSEYPRPICFNYDYSKVTLDGYSLDFQEQWFGAMPYLLVHPFDLAILKAYIVKNDVKLVTELGCGSTSRFLDRICKVPRVTFALEDMLGSGISFNKCDIFESYDVILDSCKQSDLFLIDAIHSAGMAEFYLEILKETKIPVYIHDWYLPDEQTWPEQNYWIEHILGKYYEPIVIARAFGICPKDSFVNGGIPPCCAILVHKDSI